MLILLHYSTTFPIYYTLRVLHCFYQHNRCSKEVSFLCTGVTVARIDYAKAMVNKTGVLKWAENRSKRRKSHKDPHLLLK